MKLILTNAFVFFGIALPSILFIVVVALFVSRRVKEGSDLWRVARDASLLVTLVAVVLLAVGFGLRKVQFGSESKMLVSMGTIWGYGFYLLVGVVGVSLVSGVLTFIFAYLIGSKNTH